MLVGTTTLYRGWLSSTPYRGWVWNTWRLKVAEAPPAPIWVVWQQLIAATCWPGTGFLWPQYSSCRSQRVPTMPSPAREWWSSRWRSGCLHKAETPGDKYKVGHLKGGTRLRMNITMGEGWAGLASGCCELVGYRADHGWNQAWYRKFGWDITYYNYGVKCSQTASLLLHFNASLCRRHKIQVLF